MKNAERIIALGDCHRLQQRSLFQAKVQKGREVSLETSHRPVARTWRRGFLRGQFDLSGCAQARRDFRADQRVLISALAAGFLNNLPVR